MCLEGADWYLRRDSRTFDSHDDLKIEWKYVLVCRLSLNIEESLYRGTHWVVFEPNDEQL